MHMLTMLNTGHMHVYSVHSTGEMFRCDRPLRLQIFTRGFRLGIRHRKLHSTTESGLRSACPPERQRASGGGERRDGVVRHAVRSERASGEGVLVRRRGIGVVCTCSGKPGPARSAGGECRHVYRGGKSQLGSIGSSRTIKNSWRKSAAISWPGRRAPS